MAVVARILVALGEDRIALGDQKAGRRMTRQIIIEGVPTALVCVAEREFALGALERRSGGRLADDARFDDLVVMAEGADDEALLARRCGPADRIAILPAVGVGVRPAVREERLAGKRRPRHQDSEQAEGKVGRSGHMED